jgi:hypothetical protein
LRWVAFGPNASKFVASTSLTWNLMEDGVCVSLRSDGSRRRSRLELDARRSHDVDREREREQE